MGNLRASGCIYRSRSCFSSTSTSSIEINLTFLGGRGVEEICRFRVSKKKKKTGGPHTEKSGCQCKSALLCFELLQDDGGGRRMGMGEGDGTQAKCNFTKGT